MTPVQRIVRRIRSRALRIEIGEYATDLGAGQWEWRVIDRGGGEVGLCSNRVFMNWAKAARHADRALATLLGLPIPRGYAPHAAWRRRCVRHAWTPTKLSTVYRRRVWP